MMFKRKNPETFKAIQYLGDSNKYNVAEFVKGRPFEMSFLKDGNLLIYFTKEDLSITLSPGEWLAKSIGGDLSVISDAYFKETYEQSCGCVVTGKTLKYQCDECRPKN